MNKSNELYPTKKNILVNQLCGDKEKKKNNVKELCTSKAEEEVDQIWIKREKKMDNTEELCANKTEEEIDQIWIKREKEPMSNVAETNPAEKKKKKVRFNDVTVVQEVEYYDRRTTTLGRCLDRLQKFEISRELNLFKRTEMEVHEKSHGNTRYHSMF